MIRAVDHTGVVRKAVVVGEVVDAELASIFRPVARRPAVLLCQSWFQWWGRCAALVSVITARTTLRMTPQSRRREP